MDHMDGEPLIRPHTPTEPPTTTTTTTGEGGRAGCCGRVGRAIVGVTIEPILFLYVLAAVMTGTITTNLLLDKVCLEQSYPEEICNNLTAFSTIEAEVQQQVTTTTMYLNFITSLPSVFFTLFLGSWSDKHGRKLPMVLPLLGNFVASILYVANAYYKTLPSSYILFAGLPTALTGGMSTLLMACFSYMSDITKLRSRTTRIAILDLGFSLGSPIGMILSDLLYYYVGYLGIYGVGSGLYLLAAVYTIIRVRDTCGATVGLHEGLSSPQERYRARRMCEDLFDTENVRRSFATAFQWRPNKGRAKILMLIAAMCVMVAEFGGVGLDYLYTKRVFGWDYNQYVELSVTRLLIQLAVTSVVLPVLSYRLQVADAVLVLIGCVSRVSGSLMMGLAPLPWFLYLSSVVGSLGVLPLVITRSLISKVVPAEELGRIFSVLASFEAIIPLGSGPLYTAVYNGSIKVFPGAVYMLSAALYVLAAGVFVWVFANRRTTPAPYTFATPTVANTPPTTHTHADEILDVIAT